MLPDVAVGIPCELQVIEYCGRKTKQRDSDTEAGKNELLHVNSCVLVRRLSDFRWEFDEDGGEVLRSAPSARGTILNNSHLVTGVEKMFRAPLTDKVFELERKDLEVID